MSRVDMTNEKPYYNTELNKTLRKHINKERYGDYAVLIEDILQRRAYEFKFSNDEMEIQAINLVKNLEGVEFVSRDIIGKCTGKYYPGERKIRLNQDYFTELENEEDFENFADEIYETLTHEVYHAIVEGDNESGLVYYNDEKEEWEGTALDEIFTEVAADRCTISRTSQDAERYRTNTQGYYGLTFATNLLAASLGSSEREILKSGIQNRTTFMKFFMSKFYKLEDAQYAKNELFDNFESSFDLIYNIDCLADKIYDIECLEDNDERKEIIKQTLSSSLTSLFKSAYDLASFQITSDIEAKPCLKYISQLTYRFAKLERIMQDTLDEFEETEFFTQEDKQKLELDIQNSRKSLAVRINQIDALVANKYKFKNNEAFYEQFELAKKGMLLQDTEMLKEKYDIIIREDSIGNIKSITEDLEYAEYILEEDFDNGRCWDNKPAGTILKRILDKHIQFQQESSIENIFGNDENVSEELELVQFEEQLENKSKVSDDKKSILKKAKEKVNIFFAKLKNRNLLKINFLIGESSKDNSQYYASLASMKVENQFDKRYKMDPQSLNSIDNKEQSIEVEEIMTDDSKNDKQIQNQK